MHETPSELFSDAAPVSSNAPSNSIAARTKEQLRAEANNARISSDDPLVGKGIRQEENIPNFVPGKPMTGIKLTGTADPVFAKAGYAIGDKVYHRKLKKEAKVIDMLASGPIVIKFDDGTKGKTAPENLVKL